MITGCNVLGDLGGGAFQTRLHDISGVPKINLPYSLQNKQSAVLGFQLSSYHTVAHLSNGSNLNFSPFGEFVWASIGLQDFKIASRISISNLLGDYFDLSIGYRKQIVFENTTYKAVAEAERGVFLNYGLRLGAMNFGLTVYPEANYSNGWLGITLFNWSGRSTFKDLDYTLEIGSLTNANGIYIRQLCNNLFLKDYRFQLDFHYQYWTLAQKRKFPSSEYMGHFHQLSFGCLYQPFKPNKKFQLLPYISTRLGYKRVQLYTGVHQNADFSLGGINIINEGGIRLKLPSNFIHKNCMYGFTGNYQYAYTLLRVNSTRNQNIDSFLNSLGYFGVGCFVMIDL